MVFFYILLAALLDSLLGLIGVFSLFLSKENFERILWMLVAFAAGALLGGGMYHLLKEGLERVGDLSFHLFFLGFLSFFILERILKWHHCHKLKCPVHPVSYLILIGDGIHNTIDGIIIAAAFLTKFSLGIVATLMIILHEIPQELGNYAVTVYGGFSRKKALLFNFLAQCTCILGAIIGFFFPIDPSFILPFAAGSFVYIASSDLVPLLHEEKDVKKSLLSFFIMILGIVLLVLIKV